MGLLEDIREEKARQKRLRNASSRRERTYSILREMENRNITMHQGKAQLRDLGYEDWEVDLFLDGDTTFGDDESAA